MPPGAGRPPLLLPSPYTRAMGKSHCLTDPGNPTPECLFVKTTGSYWVPIGPSSLPCPLQSRPLPFSCPSPLLAPKARLTSICRLGLQSGAIPLCRARNPSGLRGCVCHGGLQEMGSVRAAQHWAAKGLETNRARHTCGRRLSRKCEGVLGTQESSTNKSQ